MLEQSAAQVCRALGLTGQTFLALAQGDTAVSRSPRGSPPRRSGTRDARPPRDGWLWASPRPLTAGPPVAAPPAARPRRGQGRDGRSTEHTRTARTGLTRGSHTKPTRPKTDRQRPGPGARAGSCGAATRRACGAHEQRRSDPCRIAVSGRIAQRESARLTRGRSLVRSQLRPPDLTKSRNITIRFTLVL